MGMASSVIMILLPYHNLDLMHAFNEVPKGKKMGGTQ